MVKITDSSIHIEKLLVHVTKPESGAVNVFIGTTRNHSNGRKVIGLEYEAYLPMALKTLEELQKEAKNRWGLHDVTIVHRVGKVNVGEASVVIAVSSAHRDEAYQASRFLIDKLKQVVPIWKREFFEDGITLEIRSPKSSIRNAPRFF
ncbi:MAG: molybdenum cofactor biosynthesis protein MoaE [Bacteroidetes bacterium]|nr:molybdenum cofactor biosynthesis protein MoaE [Bacteroidota bacterium]